MTVMFVKNEGGKLAVEIEGGDNCPLVVCSPSMGDIRQLYDPLAAHLVAAGFRVARIDLRGQGESSLGFSRYGEDEATASDLQVVAETLGACRARPAVLLGSSMSAGAAALVAVKRPDLVAGVVLMAPFLRNGGSALLRAIMPLLFWRPWGPAVWRLYSSTLWPGLRDGDAGSNSGSLNGEGEEEASRNTLTPQTRARKLTALLTRPGRWAAFQPMSKLDHSVVENSLLAVSQQPLAVPALVVIGDKDPDWDDPLAEAAWVASRFANAETVVAPGAGHAPAIERPELVNAAVLAFLNKILVNGGGVGGGSGNVFVPSQAS